MTATEHYIQTLTALKSGELGLLRSHAGQGLDESIEAFDLFSGLWWPLRQISPKAPRREVAWLIAKIYARSPVPHSEGASLARELRGCEPVEPRSQVRFQQKFDLLLQTPLAQIEPNLCWATTAIASIGGRLDWAKLTDDLSVWQRESTRLRWANQYLAVNERDKKC